MHIIVFLSHIHENYCFLVSPMALPPYFPSNLPHKIPKRHKWYVNFTHHNSLHKSSDSWCNWMQWCMDGSIVSDKASPRSFTLKILTGAQNIVPFRACLIDTACSTVSDNALAHTFAHHAFAELRKLIVFGYTSSLRILSKNTHACFQWVFAHTYWWQHCKWSYFAAHERLPFLRRDPRLLASQNLIRPLRALQGPSKALESLIKLLTALQGR